MSQVPIRRPFGELDLCDQLRFEPHTFFTSTLMLSNASEQTLKTPSDKQIAAAEILYSQKEAFEIVPPDHRRDVVFLLVDGCHDLPKHG